MLHTKYKTGESINGHKLVSIEKFFLVFRHFKYVSYRKTIKKEGEPEIKLDATKLHALIILQYYGHIHFNRNHQPLTSFCVIYATQGAIG